MQFIVHVKVIAATVIAIGLIVVVVVIVVAVAIVSRRHHRCVPYTNIGYIFRCQAAAAHIRTTLLGEGILIRGQQEVTIVVQWPLTGVANNIVGCTWSRRWR